MTGTAPRSADPTTDHRNREELRACPVRRREHSLVVDTVARSLEPYCRSLDLPKEPELVATATTGHLSTCIEGALSDAAVPAHLLATALHPTPAAGGFPPRLASETIDASEPFDRGFYTGAVGYSTHRGDGEWMLTVHCAEVFPTHVDVFAGCGISAGSDPGAALSETTDGLRRILFALGVS